MPCHDLHHTPNLGSLIVVSMYIGFCILICFALLDVFLHLVSLCFAFYFIAWNTILLQSSGGLSCSETKALLSAFLYLVKWATTLRVLSFAIIPFFKKNVSLRLLYFSLMVHLYKLGPCASRGPNELMSYVFPCNTLYIWSQYWPNLVWWENHSSCMFHVVLEI